MIRKAKLTDADGIIRLLYQVNQVHADGRPDLFKNGGIKYTKDAVEELIEKGEKVIFVKTDDKDEVEGYVFCDIEETKETTSVYPIKTLYIDDLCVDECKRRKGIGKRLYEEACRYAKEIDCYRITLHVWECNPGAEAMYRKLGMKTLYTSMEQLL